MPKKVIITAGLPGVGKSTVAEGLSRALGFPVFSIDPIEAAMWRGGLPKESTGIAAYTVAQAVAREQLKLGHSVIVDAVNPVEAAREGWRSLAREQQARLIIIECICSDTALHKRRIENRKRGIPGMPEVTWERVEARRREYEPWHDDRLLLDTSQDEGTVLSTALAYVVGDSAPPLVGVSA